MKHRDGMVAFSVVLVALSVAQAQAAPIDITMVAVGNPGNAADSNGYGSVGYTYQIGKYDVTLSQYAAFLNAVAKTDTYGLYNTGMETDFPNNYGVSIGISRTGSSGSYSYSVMGNGNMPVFDVTWGDAARFCNWLQTGSTETGAYTMNNATTSSALMAITRNANATYVLPTQNEWYKAAYYDPTLNGGAGGYWLYPTKSDTAPSNVKSATGTNNANYDNGSYTDPQNYLTTVGYFAGSPGPYCTFDQGGDVFQWTEANISGSYRAVRGGSFSCGSCHMATSGQYSYYDPTLDYSYLGFRVAYVPEPGGVILLLAGAIAALVCWRRRRWRCSSAAA